MIRKTTIPATFFAVLFFASSAFAAEISGSIHFGGGFETDTNDLLNATEITAFLGAVVLPTPAPTGDFAGLGYAPATFQEFSFGSGLDPAPLDPLWSAGGFKFRLDNISIDVQNKTTLGLSGTGAVYYDGTDPAFTHLEETSATWVFSAQSTGDQMQFSFSANSGTVAGGGGVIPEPGTMALTGLTGAFLGLAGWRNRRRERRNAA